MVEQFCKSILQLGIKRSKSLANLIMSLSSRQQAASVVELSEEACYHYQYSSISKSINSLHEHEESSLSVAVGGIVYDAKRLETEKKFVFKERQIVKTI